jgi:citrate lyase subunit beta / citryl-CoA lyase
MENSYKPLRSLMFVPGHNKRLIESASRSKADALILDIEDSVQPFENKALARETIKEYVTSNKLSNYQIFVRINDRESGLLLKDVNNLSLEGITGFVYPKSKKGEDIYFFDKLLETIEYEKGLEIGTFKIIPLIETAAAVLNAQDICESSSRVIAIAYGCEDFITDLKGIHDVEGQSLFTPRAMIAMAARATNRIPIDTVHINVHDLEHLEENLKISRTLGFEGMLVLHPKEIELCHRYYSPSSEEIQDAEEMLRLSELAQKEGRGVAILDGKFIGPPMVLKAKYILQRAKQIEMRNQEISK